MRLFKPHPLLASLLALLLYTPSLLAQSAGDSLKIPVGEPVARLTAASDTSQHYALYIPTSYSTDQPPPVIFLMDPRGRAMTPLALFQDVAERYGYMLMSSYETLSDADSAFAVNERALNAMLQDAQLRFTIDPVRIYLAGFSGTAHYAWFAAASLDGHLAGIIGVGDGFSPHYPSVQATMKMQRPVAYFGVAGNRDFNFDNAWRRHRDLDGSALPHRFMTYDGPHAWPPKVLAEAAVEWMELQAVRNGLAHHTTAWIKALYAAALDEALTLEQAGRPVNALWRYQEIERDFTDLVAPTQARQRADALAQDPNVQRTLALWHDLAERADQYKRKASDFVATYGKEDTLPSHRRALRLLDIRKLQRESADTTQPDVAAAAQRMLASASSQTGFYGPRDFFAQGDFKRAAGLLRIAHEISPTAPFTCYWLARAEAQLGRVAEALDALSCALNGPWLAPEQLATDALLDPLRNEVRFQEMVTAYTGQ